MKKTPFIPVVALLTLVLLASGCGQPPQEQSAIPKTPDQTGQLESILKRGAIRVGFDTLQALGHEGQGRQLHRL